MTNLNENNIDFNFNLKIVEALIFASPEPVSFNELKKTISDIDILEAILESLEKKYTNNLKIWSIDDLNTNKGKNEILDFINFNLERKIDREFKHNTNLKSRKESIINKIKKWF